MKRLTKNQVNQIKRLALKGASDKEIAEKTGANLPAVNYHAKQMRAAVKKTAEKVGITKHRKQAPKREKYHLPEILHEDQLAQYFEGLFDGMATRYDIPREMVDRIALSTLKLPLFTRVFGGK